MKLYRIPQPWDYHGAGAVFVVAKSAADAVARVQAREETEKEREVVFYQHQSKFGRPGRSFDVEGWAKYRAENDLEYDSTFTRGGFEYEGVEEVPDGFGVAEGCDC